MSESKREGPPMVTLCKGDNFEVNLVCYPSGVCLEVDAVTGSNPNMALIYSEGLTNIDKIAKRLEEGEIG
jgi:hypothetical protein